MPEPDTASSVRDGFGALEPDVVDEARRTVAGRIVLKRDMGKLGFLVLRDGSGDIQLVVNQETTDPESRALLAGVDLGDIVGATGRVGTTRKGELSIFVERLAMLTKALRPLPEKWHGLKDPELQQRQRYLQLATDPDARKRLVDALHPARDPNLSGRARVRRGRDAGPADGRGARDGPFVTHHRDLDMDLYLRISLELHLKRLLVGGLERVYEIGRNFRNEGVGWKYNPEFTMLELYQTHELRDDDGRHAISAAGERARGGRLARDFVRGTRSISAGSGAA